MTMFRFVFVVVLCWVSLRGVWAEEAVADRPVMTVAVVSPKRVLHRESLAAEGEVAARELAAVNAQVAGVALQSLHADVGDVVRKGDVLARFDSVLLRHELAQAQAALSRAQAGLKLAKSNAARARKLMKDRAMSQLDADQFLAAEQEAQAALDGAVAARDAAQVRLDDAQVRAPVDGVVVARPAELGMTANVGLPLFTLMRDGALEWQAQVDALAVGRLAVGSPARVDLGDGRFVNGRVARFAPVADVRSRRVTVFVAMEGDALLRAGLFLRGAFLLDEVAVLLLPVSAVVREDGYDVVVRVDADGRVVREKVRLGARLEDRVAVVGVPEDARVVVRGGAFLQDGDVVRVEE